ncbi:Ig-like domain-containing protein [Saezia sanguinis]|nr:Ig-like domain-containing protein [Saezia sanguinis]
MVKPTGGQTITDGILEIEAQASDMAGVSYVGFYLDEESIGSASEEPYAITYSRSSVANGPHALSAVVMNVNGNINRDARSIEFMVPPQILEPFYSEVIRPEVSVQGTARLPAAAQVQLYLNDEAVGTPIVTQSNGTFSTTLVLPEEGEYTLSADATYEFGTTPKSTPRAFGLHFTTPVVHWIRPATNATLTEATLLEVRVSDQVDVTQIELFVDDQLLTTWAQQSETDYYTYLWDIAGLDNGRHELKVRATNEYGKVAELTRSVVVQAFVPQITAPVNGASTNQAQITVEGLAYQGVAVQVYANGIAQGERVVANAQGHFSVPVVLPAEGNYSITADAQTPNGTSDLSVPVEVRFALPVPRAAFVTPANNAVLSASTMIEVSAADALGIDRVEFYADEHLLGTVTQAPYAYAWPVELDDNGTHTLMARVYNTSGKQVSVVRQVQVDVPEPVPPVPPTPYTGVVQSVTPAVSYGDVPVEIAGHAVNRASGQPAAHTPLKLVLTVKGFERQINVVTDAQGNFTYEFVPQESDAGVYGVTAVHPDESGVNSQGSFDIRRVRFAYSGYSLTAARNYASQVNVRATVSSDTTGLRWVIRAEDQPSGSLPNGIRIDTGSGIDIAAGGSADVGFTFTADDSAGESGTVILAALADDSGTRVRARLQLNYRLIAAASGLYPEQTYIETGVQQDSSVTEQLVIGNRGLVSATNVQVALVDEQGNPAPQWVFVAGSTALGDVAVGEYATVEIVAQPDATITDGMYRFNLLIRSDNDAGGTVPVAVAVVQSGQGGMRFQVEDIYTGTLGEGGQPVAGVGGVRIKLQNEVVLSEQYMLVTDDAGMALIEELPPGVYSYRASVANHMDVSGRLRIRPGVTGSQYIFMDYQLVSIEFSVTETTIQDIYDVILEATFNTQVPAPVVLLEPLSINIAGMQAGEVRTGELTLTNYGLIEAQEVNFQPAQSDAQFRYEFFADIPDTLPPKTRIVIPYRVTALGGSVQGRSAAVQTQGTTALGLQNFVAASTAEAASAADCTSYTYPFYVDYQYECINGQWVKSGNGGYFIYLQGQSCKPTSVNWSTSGSGGGGGGWINGGWSGATATPMAPACTPNAQQGVCTPGGGSLPPGLGGSGSSMGGAGSLGTPR